MLEDKNLYDFSVNIQKDHPNYDITNKKVIG